MPEGLEITENQDEDEDIVDAERLLNEVTRQELQGRARPEPEPHTNVEGQSECNPDGGPCQGLAHPDDMRLSMKQSDVQREHRDDEQRKATPKGHCVVHQLPPDERSVFSVTSGAVRPWPSVI